MAAEIPAAFAFLKMLFVGDAELVDGMGGRWFKDFAPDVDPDDPDSKQPPAYPLGIISEQANSDVMAMGRARVFTKPLMHVRVIGDTGYGDIVPLYDRVDEVIRLADAATVTVNGVDYLVQATYREKTTDRSELAEPENVRYDHLGGLYRMFVRKAA